MSNSTTLPDATRMGAVTLDVADVDLMSSFYTDVLLLDRVADRGHEVDLGRDQNTLVTLRHRPDLTRGERRSAGLFHTAILHETQTALATTLASFATSPYTHLWTGPGDHLVSQAFYLDDPEGNGVELYYDRPRDQWQWDGDRVRMATLPIDTDAFLTEHLTPEARAFVHTDADRRGSLPDGTTVGHVHLKVGDTAQARDFYVDTLGFDITAEWHGALFVSAGGYHHHLAMNTWNSAGAGLRAPALGLGRVDIVLPTPDAVGALTERAAARGVRVRPTATGAELDDPWGNLVRVTAS